MTHPLTSQQQVVVVPDGKTTSFHLKWYHEKDLAKESFYSRKDNTQVSPLICGSNTLPEVAEAIKAAKKSIEISVWVFDPALTMKGYNQAVTREHRLGESIRSASPKIGDLLLAASNRGVKVRLLVWNPGDLMYNTVRIMELVKMLREKYPTEKWLIKLATGKLAKSFGVFLALAAPPIIYSQRDAINNWLYRRLWYEEVVPGNTNIQLRAAGPDPIDMGKEIIKNISAFTSEYDEDICESDQYVLAKLLREIGPSYHQKTVMVDYEDPERACAFVMGNNFRSVDYDTPEHPVNPPKEGERFPGDAPRQDISAKVLGQALYDINDSFCKNWLRWGGGDLKRSGIKPAVFAQQGEDLIQGDAQVSCTFLGAKESGFICDAYEAAIKCCTSHLYIENQYFRYQPLIETFTTYPAARKGGDHKANGDPLYYFIVINKPDPYAKDPTYDALKELGHEGQMAGVARQRYTSLVEQRKELLQQQPPEEPEKLAKINKEIDDLANNQPEIGKSAKEAEKVETPAEAFAVRDLADKGFKGHVATLTVCRAKSYRPWNSYEYKSVNIHSKLMIVDDVFVTIGSANFNTRGMVSDAEMNISTTQRGIAAKLRKELFKQHFEGPIAENATPEDLYDLWEKRLVENWKKVYNNKSLSGKLAYMYDHKKRIIPNLDS